MDFGLIAASGDFSWFAPESWLAILKMVAALGFIVFVHELGHFLVAKACGVKCEKFYIGFDAFDVRIGDLVLIPAKLVHFQWGETEYGIGIIPLGGYVKMLGQDDNPSNMAREAEWTRLAGAEGDAASTDGDEASTDGDAESADRDTAAGSAAPQLDPRSYPAKSVPQRFAIISAGVIMNLIFAVVFAAIAYGIGAPYQPAVIGSTVPGGPAWIADVRPGTRVLRINDSSKNPDHLRFTDLAEAVALNGASDPVRLQAQVPGSEAEQSIELTPVTNLYNIKLTSLASIGIEPASKSRLAEIDVPVTPGMAASRATPAFEPGDRIVEVNGQPTEMGYDLQRVLANIPDDIATFVVERGGDGKDAATTRVTITVPVQPLKRTGIVIEYGDVAAVQLGSPAAEAGVRAGDRIETLDATPVGDILLLNDRLRRKAAAGEDATLGLIRVVDGKHQHVDVVLRPRAPREMGGSSSFGHLPYAIETIGVAVNIRAKVAGVEPGSPAETAGIRSGDELVSVRFLRDNAPIPEETDETPLSSAPVEFGDSPQGWPIVNEFVQFADDRTTLEVTVRRGDDTVVLTTGIVESTEFHSPKRGIMLAPYEETLTAGSVGEAFSLGLRQTKEDTLKIYMTLRQIMLGKVSAINLRGPGTIASAATMIALKSNSEFLLFLTLIGANLAVVNFLPIPVLDGGHAMFLTYEGIFRKPMPEKLVFIMSMAGLAAILMLMIFVITMDLFQWVIF